MNNITAYTGLICYKINNSARNYLLNFYVQLLNVNILST